MKKIERKSLLNVLFLVSVFGLTVWSVFKGEDLGKLAESLALANPLYIAASILCVLLFIIGESVIILYLLRTLGTRVKFRHCCLFSFIGFFYSCITPSASGGQPMQVVAMRKDGIPAGIATVVLAIVTITYKLVLVVIGVAVMVFQPASVMPCLEGVYGLVYLGVALNVICIAILLLLVFKPGLVHRMSEATLRLIHRIRPFKKLDKLERRLDRAMNQYAGTAEYYRSHKLVILNVFVISFLQRVFLFVVTWLAYRAFGLSGHSLFTVVTLQAMISVVVDMLPLPGGMGISENLFLQIFLPVFGAALVLPGMMISRGISYYTQLLISAVMTVVASFILRKRD